MLWRDGQAVGSRKQASIYADCCEYLSGLEPQRKTEDEMGKRGAKMVETSEKETSEREGMRKRRKD